MDGTRRNAPAAWASWINVILGIWLIVSPWVLGFTASGPDATWNSVILGIAVLILAYLGATTDSAVPCWWNIVLGIWLVISPYVLRFNGTPRAEPNTMAFGVIIGILALVAGLAKMPPTTSRAVHT
jgi:hypothetical protein